VRDRRFFFQQYTLALVKYLKAYGVSHALATPRDPTLSEVANVKLDTENVFWDISDVNLFDKIEYIERDFVTAGTDLTDEPIDFEYGSDIKVANQRTTNWDHKMSRSERAMYQSLMGNSTAPLGKLEAAQITNLFGTDVLAGTTWYQGAAAWESLACATTGNDGKNPPCANSNVAPYAGSGDFHLYTAGAGNDSKGAPLFNRYRGAWEPTIFHRGNSPITIQGFLGNVQAAKVAHPQYTSAYDSTTPVVQVVKALIPHLPAQPGIGFNVPISGTRDKFIQAGNLSYVGNTTTYDVKYQYQTCSLEKLELAQASKACNTASQQNYICEPGKQPAAFKGDTISADSTCKISSAKRPDGQDNYCCDGLQRPQFIPVGTGAGAEYGALIKVLAINSQDYLGDVFMCGDPRTGDVLRMRMYDSAQSALDWFTAHPGTIQACDIVIRYSPFNNYIDEIFSRTFGVSLNISKSFGAGRVADAMVWDPALLAQ
jgi:hypothetical protein